MARVNVEQAALTDPRYAILGRAIGADKWAAIGRMVAVWNHCQETNRYVLDFETVNHLFDDISGFSEALLKSGLGKKHRHGIYISGTKGRIEWLETKRANGRKGGRPKVNREENRNETERKPIGSPSANPPAPAPAPAPAIEHTSPSETKNKKGAKELVEEFELTADLRLEARSKYPLVDVTAETTLWYQRLRANGYRTNAGPVKDAVAAWRYWMGSAQKRAAERAGPRQQALRPIKAAPLKSE
jgi:hypothetical protein